MAAQAHRPPWIAVFGGYKTGTTALFTKIRDALPWAPRALFEPAGYDPQPEDAQSGVLAKVIVGLHEPESAVDYEAFIGFDRQVMLRRDPRDWLVSAVLFLPQQLPQLWDDAAQLERVLGQLRRKEADPRSVDITQLFAAEMALNGMTLYEALDRLRRHHAHLLAFERRLASDRFILRYEDLVDDKLDGLAAHLGVSIPPGPVLVDSDHRHVPRTLTYGNWRHWLTDTDVALLRPVFAPYMEACAYEDDWTLADDPAIETQHASGYVERTVALRRETSGA